ncbi:MAG: hypothetical protein ACYC5M_16340 [Anaerolineae bacterium]
MGKVLTDEPASVVIPDSRASFRCALSWLRKALLSGEAGISLPMALLVLVIGTLLVVPLFGFARSRQTQMASLESVQLEQYAADAGAEYVLNRLSREEPFRSVARSHMNPNPPLTMTLPITEVNQLPVTMTLTCAQRTFHYAIWGNSRACSTDINWLGGNNDFILGDIHSNSGVNLKNIDIDGTVEYSSGTGTVPAGTVLVLVEPWDLPELFDFNQYANPSIAGSPAAVAQSQGEFFSYPLTHTLTVGDLNTCGDGIYYIRGNADLKFNDDGFDRQVTIVAEGTIKISAPKAFILRPYADQLVFFTRNSPADKCGNSGNVVDISGSGSNMLLGYIYAPYGRVNINSSGQFGGVIGDSVDMTGSNFTVVLPPRADSQPSCEFYDVHSFAGDTVTQARLGICYDDDTGNVISTELSSWRVAGTP